MLYGGIFMRVVYSEYISPIGLIYVIMNETGVKEIIISPDFIEEHFVESGAIQRDDSVCSDVIKQLHEYFSGKRYKFDVPLSIEGTEFYKKVWERVQSIPYGQTRSYGEIALEVGNPKAVRAVGQANRRNPIPIIIPCHRVIGKNGDLTGYMGSRTDIKKQLIEMEQEYMKNFNTIIV